MNIIVLLDKFGINDNDIKKIFTKFIKEYQYGTLEENVFAEFIADFSSLDTYKNNELENLIINLIKENCSAVVLEDNKGGYYDTLKAKYKNKSERVCPLGCYGSLVGTYTESTSYLFYGDLLVQHYSRYWYDTSKYDSNNYSLTTYYFKDNRIESEVKNKNIITDILTDSENYELGNYIINFKNGYINVIGEKILSYEGNLSNR